MTEHCTICGKFVEDTSADFNPIIKYESFDGPQADPVCRKCIEAGKHMTFIAHDAFVKDLKKNDYKGYLNGVAIYSKLGKVNAE